MTADIRAVVAKIAGGGPVRASGGSYMVRCPAHPDDKASLNISPGNVQPIVFHCHAGCTPEAVMEAAGITAADISAPLEGRQEPVAADVIYPYHDEQGTELFQVVRKPDKKFLQRHADGNGRWVWNLQGVRRVIYRLPEVIEGVRDGKPVWIVEGEKDADALRARGHVATCNPGGAGKWRQEYAEVFGGAVVTIVADPDTGGRDHARAVRDSVKPVAASVRIVEAKRGKDAYDHLVVHGLSIDDFTVTVPAEVAEAPVPTMDIDEYLAQELPPQVFVIPDALAEREIWMVTGWEGHGKSLLGKQVAMQVASGVHPWTLKQMDPRRVLLVDVENATRDNHADLTRLRALAMYHGRWEERERLMITEPGVIDVLTPRWHDWLVERVTEVKPHLLIMGPIYKMVGLDLRDEPPARALMRTITDAQQVSNCAVILEHHVAKGQNGERTLDPLGSGLLMRWCNFVTGLRPIEASVGFGEPPVPTGMYALEHVRGKRRRERVWPTHLRWGVKDSYEWPWEPLTAEEAEYRLSEAGGRMVDRVRI